MLLSSYRRTKLNSSMDLGNILGSATSADIVPQVSLEETNVDESGSAGAFFVTQKPFGSATTSAKLNASQDNSAFSTGQTITNVSSSGRETRKATYPTYTAESFPTCFVTGSYRPRTLAELVLMLIDMKRAVIKTPSLVDDNTPPAAKTSVKVNPKAAAAINVMMRGGAKKKTASATLGASSTAHKAESAPPPLIRGDSGISRAAKLKSALASASPASAISAAVHVSAANKGSPASKGVPQYVSLPENAPSADVNHSGKESAVRVSEVVPLAKVGKSGSFQSKLVPSAPAPLVKQHSGMGSQLQGVADGRASIAVTVVANVISTENAMHMNTGNVGNGGGGGAGSVPAQLRANNRVLRPSSVVITTPAPVPAPYPFAPTAATTTATSTGSANATTDSRSSTPQKLQVDANLHVQLHEHTHRDQIEDSKSIQGITPSAIIAAAKATLRDAETTVMPNEPVRRQSLSSRGRQLSALLESSSKRTPNARTPKSSTTTEVESNFLGSVEEKIHLNIDF